MNRAPPLSSVVLHVITTLVSRKKTTVVRHSTVDCSLAVAAALVRRSLANRT
jgi:hypothetical protein